MNTKRRNQILNKLREGDFPGRTVLTPREAAAAARKAAANPRPMSEYLPSIFRYSDLRFRTKDDREFGLFFDSDSIEHRLRATSAFLVPAEREELHRIAGFILETGCEEVNSKEADPPLVYSDWNALASAWIGLHQLYGVKLAGDELDWCRFVAEVEFTDEENDEI